MEAPTLARLFIDAARAMSDQLGELADENALAAARAGSEARQLSVVAATADQLLAAWLGELLYSARQTRHLFSTINVRRINPGHLRAELRGEREIALAHRSVVGHRRRRAASPRCPTRWRSASSRASGWRRCGCPRPF